MNTREVEAKPNTITKQIVWFIVAFAFFMIAMASVISAVMLLGEVFQSWVSALTPLYLLGAGFMFVLAAISSMGAIYLLIEAFEYIRKAKYRHRVHKRSEG